jgi:hypothetical protein
VIACGLTEDHLYSVAPSLRDDREKQVVAVMRRVGVARGTVFDWSKRGGHSFTLKLHWNCPQCGQQWWEDFTDQSANPHFGASGCDCADWWLVEWDPLQADEERAC